MLCFGKGLCGVQVVFQIIKPFIDQIVTAIGEPSCELRGKVLQPYLCAFDANPLDLCLKHYLSGEGVEGHLVVWRKLLEPIIPNGRGGCFVIDDEDVFVYVDNTVEMAAEEIGRVWMP